MSKKFWRLGIIVTILTLLCGTVVNAAQGTKYYIEVNRATNYVAVYGPNADGEYNVPVIEFICSTGKNNATPCAATAITERYAFRKMYGKAYAQHATRFNGNCLLHGVPTSAMKKNTLITKYYNQLGEQASAGCVRLADADAQWIYENCAKGSVVKVIDDPNDYGPFGKPAVPKIPDGHPYANWDPTDLDPNNPWINERPVVKLVANSVDGATLSLPAGASYETLYNSIGLATPQGEAYAAGSYALDIYGVYDLNTSGRYTLYVRGHDLATTLRGDLDVTLIVD